MAAEVVGHAMNQAGSIPITNLYYLLCYAWNHFREGQIISVGGARGPSLQNLLSTVLLNGSRHLLRHGLDRGYMLRREDTTCLKGRVVLADTLQRNLAELGIAHCEFDQFEYDVLHNQILKTTLQNLSQTNDLDQHLRHHISDLIRRFSGVSIIRLNRFTFRKLQLNRNNSFYDFLMKVCELVQEALQPEERTGRFRFRDILRNELTMSKVFQEFVFNFYRLEQKAFRVSSDRIRWNIEVAGRFDEMLPSMITDVSLRSKRWSLIIDAKYYTETFQNFRGSETIRSAHLYQIFAYLKNLEARGQLDAQAAGLLLYPTVSKQADFVWKIQGHKIRVYTISLTQDWADIRRELLELLDLEGSGWANAQGQ